MDKKNINYKTKYWSDALISCFNASLENGRYLFNNEQGKGSIVVSNITEDMHIAIFDAQLSPSPGLLKVLIQGAAQCSIIFLLPGSQSIYPGAFDTHTISVSFHENNVYFIPSPATISIHAKNNTVLKVLSITFSQKWLFSYLSQIHIKQKKLIRHLISSGKDMVLYEPMVFPLQQLAETLAATDWQQPFVNILANAKILEVLHTLLTLLSTRKKNNQKTINKADYEQIRNIVIMLSENWQKRCPSIQEVALLTHMSPSKFKKLFRTIHEKPYYSFFLHLRLLRCMELLKSGIHSVTEVAYIAGYSRPSKFSEVFKQHFKLSPSSIIKQK